MFTSGKHLDNLCKIFRKALESVHPEALFNKSIEKVKVGKRDIIKIKSDEYDLTDKKCHIIGFGKAVLGMAVQLERVLGNRLKSGILSVPIGTGHIFKNIKIYEGAENNLPDNKSMATALKIKNLAENLNKDDILFVLISGGGSALLPIPTPPITLAKKLAFIKELANKGASISEINAVRIKISETKGGKLAQAASKAHKIISLVLSDIIGDPLHLIASGPTVPYLKTSPAAQSILEKYQMWNGIEPEIKECISKNSAPIESSHNCSIYVIGNNTIAAENCLKEAKILGYSPIILSTSIEGNVIDVANTYTKFILNIKKLIRNEITESTFSIKFPFVKNRINDFFECLKSARETRSSLCLILAGEPTVHVTGTGKGGRNQELALRISLSFYENELLKDVAFLSAGTDGIDGPTNAAGALGSQDIVAEFLKNNTLDKANFFLRNSDSFNFYQNIENGKYHIITGHTGTNVMDLHLFIVPIT